MDKLKEKVSRTENKDKAWMRPDVQNSSTGERRRMTVSGVLNMIWKKKIKERVIWQIKCGSIIFVWSYCTSRHGFPFGLMNKNLCGGLPTHNYLPDP